MPDGQWGGEGGREGGLGDQGMKGGIGCGEEKRIGRQGLRPMSLVAASRWEKGGKFQGTGDFNLN